MGQRRRLLLTISKSHGSRRIPGTGRRCVFEGECRARQRSCRAIAKQLWLDISLQCELSVCCSSVAFPRLNGDCPPGANASRHAIPPQFKPRVIGRCFIAHDSPGSGHAGGTWIPAAPLDSEAVGTNGIQLSLENASIDMVVQWLAQTTGKAVIKSPTVQCQVTIASPKKVSKREAL